MPVMEFLLVTMEATIGKLHLAVLDQWPLDSQASGFT